MHCIYKTKYLHPSNRLNSRLLLIVLGSKINKRLVFFSSAVRSGIFTGVTESC